MEYIYRGKINKKRDFYEDEIDAGYIPTYGDWVCGRLTDDVDRDIIIYNEKYFIPIIPETVGLCSDIIIDGWYVFEGDVLYDSSLNCGYLIQEYGDSFFGRKLELKPLLKDYIETAIKVPLSDIAKSRNVIRLSNIHEPLAKWPWGRVKSRKRGNNE